MKNSPNRTWQQSRPTWRDRFSFDYTTALGSLAVALLGYILYHIYPLIAKGVLW